MLRHGHGTLSRILSHHSHIITLANAQLCIIKAGNSAQACYWRTTS